MFTGRESTEEPPEHVRCARRSRGGQLADQEA